MRFSRIAPAFLAGALAFGGLTQPALAGGADLALLPSTGAFLVHIDMERMRGSAFYKEIVAPMLKTPNFVREMNEARTKLGFDPINDLNTFTMVVTPPGGFGAPEALMVMEGKVNKENMIAMAVKEAKAVKGEYNGVELWATAPGGEDVGLAFVGGKALIGHQKMVREAIDGSKGKPAANAQMLALTKTVNQTADLWFIGTVPESARAEMAKGNPAMGDVKTVRGSLDLSKGLAVVISVGASASGAKAMADMIQAATKLDPQTEPMMAQMGLLPVIKKLKVEAKGDDLNVGLDLDTADVNRLKMLVGMVSAMGGAGAPPMPMEMPAEQK